jgi:Protein of unknown function (DUF3034)
MQYIKYFAFLCLLLAPYAFAGDRLLATGGVSQIEGTGGGGLVPWAMITGYGTDQQTGASAFYTVTKTRGGFEIDSVGAAVGFYNRFELSLSQTKFGLSNTVPHTSIKLNTLGMKLRLVGDAIYDQDIWYPQLSVGMQIKHNEDFDFVPKLIGAEHSTGVDYYLTATKLYLAGAFGRNLLLSTTLRTTKANQFGILGFGGDKNDQYQLMPSFTAAIMLRDNLITGIEYRNKPNNINTFKEQDANSLYAAWFPYKNFSITGAYVDLGNIADKSNQTAWYLSGQVSY